jgi:hypothetical protein
MAQKPNATELIDQSLRYNHAMMDELLEVTAEWDEIPDAELHRSALYRAARAQDTLDGRATPLCTVLVRSCATPLLTPALGTAI